MAGELSFDPIAEARRNWEKHWDDPPADAMEAVTSIMRAQQILLARLNDRLKPFDLTFPRYEALMLLYYSRNGALPLGKMGVRLQVHRTSLTSLVDGLERSGFARRVPHEHDGRTTLAEITAAGREVAKQASAALHGDRFATEPLADPELAELAAILRRLRAGAGDF